MVLQEPCLRPVWAEINLDNLIHNLMETKRIIKRGTLVAATVKADAYGHGSIEVAKAFLENGADRLAVATLTEALELRNAGIGSPILVLGYTPENQFDQLIDRGVTATVYDPAMAKALSEASERKGMKTRVHVKIDTGMGRLGFLPQTDSIKQIKNISRLRGLELEGIFTHFAASEETDETYTREQYEKFEWVVEKLEAAGVDIPLKHVSNSAAVMYFPEYNLDMVRPGSMLYGLYPRDVVEKSVVDLRLAMTLKARLSNVKMVPAGTGISYGVTYRTKVENRIGTLPIGYADGFRRKLSNTGVVGVNGRRARIVGRVCMDQCMIDVTGMDEVKIGDQVTLFGDGEDGSPSIYELANMLDTIPHEIATNISRRVPRVYLRGGKIVKIRDYLLDQH